jgi:hypothetical protein
MNRLRATGGKHAGLWLWTMSVTKGGLTFQVTNWERVERQQSQYVFHPQFIPEEGSAFQAISIEHAERLQLVLKREGIETEIL